jgi:hypothetical protein
VVSTTLILIVQRFSGLNADPERVQ